MMSNKKASVQKFIGRWPAIGYAVGAGGAGHISQPFHKFMASSSLPHESASVLEERRPLMAALFGGVPDAAIRRAGEELEREMRASGAERRGP